MSQTKRKPKQKEEPNLTANYGPKKMGGPKKGNNKFEKTNCSPKKVKGRSGPYFLKPSKREQLISLPIIRQNNLKGPSGPSKWKQQKLETRSSSLVEGPRFEFQYLWIGEPSYTLKIYGAGWGQLFWKTYGLEGPILFWNFEILLLKNPVLNI